MFWPCLYIFFMLIVTFCSLGLFCAAVRAESIECVRLILEQETVNVNCQNYINSSALHAAVSAGRPDVTELLLQHGGRADILEDMNITPVFTASQHGQTECLKLLLDSLTTSGAVVDSAIIKQYNQYITFHVTVARAWNSLPTSITALTSLPSFKRQLKTFLFTKSFPSV